MDALGPDSSLKVLVVDDDATWVETLVAQFKHRSIGAEGVSAPTEMFKWTTSDRFTDVDMIFLDMRLGISRVGVAITAAEVLLHLMTYSPSAKVVVFTQEEITVDECVRCIQLGALGIIPKTSDVDHLILVARVYRHVGDEQKAREQRIRSLWAKLEEDRDDPAKGRQLEMLMINMFNSIDGFDVVSHNREILAGELDLVVENRGKDQFWTQLNSFHFVVECKNESSPTEKKEFNVLSQKVHAKQGCTVGILVSMAGVSSGFRDLQTAGTNPVTKIFHLAHPDLLELVRRPASGREEYLRRVFSGQL
jgi:ActR/RegA family two-component response regulator